MEGEAIGGHLGGRLLDLPCLFARICSIFPDHWKAFEIRGLVSFTVETSIIHSECFSRTCLSYLLGFLDFMFCRLMQDTKAQRSYMAELVNSVLVFLT